MTTVMFCALSLFVGVLIGVVLRDAIDLLRSGRKGVHMSEAQRTLAYRTLIVLLSVAFVANAVTGVFLLTTRQAATDYARCVAHWQQSWARAYEARYRPAVRVDRALDRVIEAVAAKNADAFHSAIVHYTHLRTEQTQARKAHPLPPLPGQVCGPPSGATK